MVPKRRQRAGSSGAARVSRTRRSMFGQGYMSFARRLLTCFSLLPKSAATVSMSSHRAPSDLSVPPPTALVDKGNPYTSWVMIQHRSPCLNRSRCCSVGWGDCMTNEILRGTLAMRRRNIGAAFRRSCGFTPAEWRAVQGLASGLRPAEIADLLGLSVHTIRTQLKRAMCKARVHSQAALVVRVLSAGRYVRSS